MEKGLFWLNIVYAVLDTAIAGVAIFGFFWCANRFEKWWLILFTIIPLMLYSNHTLIINDDLLSKKEGDDDS